MTAWNENPPQARPRNTAASGDNQRLLEELWPAQSRRLLSIAWRITRSREDAEDALQDTFLRALTHIGDFDGRSTPSTWLTRIAINSSLMILRKRRTRATAPLEGEGEDGSSAAAAAPGDPRPGPEELAVRSEGVARLHEHLDRLPVLLRRPLLLHALEEHSVEETAQLCRISVSAAKSRLFRARTRLGASLQAHHEIRRQQLAS